MSKKIKQLFKNVSQMNPPEKLAGLILAKIEKIRKKRFWTKIAFSAFGVFASASASLYIFTVYGNSLLSSEFWRILSLVFSDAAIIASHYPEFFLSLLETLPAMTFAIMLIPIFTLLLSIYSIFEIYNNKFNQPKYYFQKYGKFKKIQRPKNYFDHNWRNFAFISSFFFWRGSRP